MKASVMLEHEEKYTIILAFDVKIERDAQEMADNMGVKIFQVYNPQPSPVQSLKITNEHIEYFSLEHIEYFSLKLILYHFAGGHNLSPF